MSEQMTTAWDGKPPGNPAVSAWHWLEYRRGGYIERRPFRWEKDGWWVDGAHWHHREWISPYCFGGWRYLAPCICPTEAAA